MLWCCTLRWNIFLVTIKWPSCFFYKNLTFSGFLYKFKHFSVIKKMNPIYMQLILIVYSSCLLMCQICIYFYSFNTRKKTAHHMMIHSVNSVSQLSSHVHMMWLYCTCEKYVWNNTAGAGVSRSREVQRDQVPVGELRVFGVCMELWEVQHLYRALEGYDGASGFARVWSDILYKRASFKHLDLCAYVWGFLG